MTHIPNAHLYGVCLCLIRLPFASFVLTASLCSLCISIHVYTVHCKMIIEFFLVAAHALYTYKYTNSNTCKHKSRLREGFAHSKGKLNFYKFFSRHIVVCLCVVVSLLHYYLVFHLLQFFFFVLKKKQMNFWNADDVVIACHCNVINSCMHTYHSHVRGLMEKITWQRHQ